MCIFLEEGTSWRIFGQLTNETGLNQEDVLVEAIFFAADGSSTGNDWDYVFVDIMPAGVTLPFDIIVDSSVAPAEYGFDVSGVPGETSPRDDLQVTDPQLMYAGDDLVIVGQAHNPGADLVYYAELIATLYNEQGKVVAVGYELLDADELGASDSAPFEIFTDGLLDLVTDYVVIALGF